MNVEALDITSYAGMSACTLRECEMYYVESERKMSLRGVELLRVEVMSNSCSHSCNNLLYLQLMQVLPSVIAQSSI